MVETKSICLESKGDTDIIDITEKVIALLKSVKIADGIVALFVPGSTGSITTIEYEPGCVADLKKAFEKIAPRDGTYSHNGKWGDGNGFSHVRASLLGPGVTVPVSKGKLTLGTWQQIIFVDFDNRPRSREIIAQFVGE
jgi:secondary thiamine-phosphate synthase enzyme